MHTVRGDGVAGIKRHRRGLSGDGARNLATTSGHGQLKEDLESSTWRRSGYQQKDRKPSQNDKTEHGMEKTVQNQGQSPKMPKSESILKNQQSNRSGTEESIECNLNPADGPESPN
ncbi:hypothetical protein Tco_0975768 [Tanacetum coccineum]|uniref:Uncharacterized protein n=1 Tax=Tanacetum coccineum TaxID=301880 RepID=A0ABQ5EFE4_9ASTR